ncbi:MAG: tetratricopeptide repeat protein [Chthonomonadaceae bacterium]|nr:tetratricopeptide repeat protein [Chthonomonadaceae bacterium]
MVPEFHVIKQLFDLPGSDEAIVDKPSATPGRDAKQSREFGQYALADGKWEEAVDHFCRAVTQSDERSPWALMDLGAAYEAQDKVPQAFRQYLKAAHIKKSGELQVALAGIYARLGRSNDAIESLKEAVNLEPHNAFNHYKLADTLRKNGWGSEAVQAAQVAVACAPDQSFYHYWLGDLLLELRRYDESVDALHAAIELSPGDDELYFLASQALWGAHKQQEAVRAIRLASDIDTENLLYHGLLERYLRTMGLDEEADLECRKIDKLEEYDLAVLKRVIERLQLNGVPRV